MKPKSLCLLIALASFCTIRPTVLAQAAAAPANPADTRPVVGPGYDNTPVIPGTEWRVHDNRRPHPPVADPDEMAKERLPTAPPEGAVILFDGTDLSGWLGKKNGPAMWEVQDGHMEAVKKSGSIRTEEAFGSCQLHVEWASPNPPKGNSQGRGNSGVFLANRYEVQILDSYNNKTYADGQCAALYGQKPPDYNVCRGPGEWQTYDIFFEAPVFKGRDVVKKAVMTVYHNSVLVHDKVELLGRSSHKKVGKYSPHGKGPIQLQDHGNPVRYRNIWIKLTD
ncbi:MAG: DUF1080 domain-containing protein [Lentisphaerae bacterium]|nr:DUF1080 domain-containing protein [Lentisphaerota bacterium]MBT5606479.1 DUF1080 domain-containing protein [Lentisphaerota bacterium]MBT7058861.1 DUF1080 domain-containing protein [Lentisphaerota bacterium]MBT7846478.1 DUF1080 domain-containing protein [Lentisphaerota bacterium]